MEDQGLMNGLNIYCGQVTHPAVAKALSFNYHEPKEVMLA
jgi:alanine dehydrogenase